MGTPFSELGDWGILAAGGEKAYRCNLWRVNFRVQRKNESVSASASFGVPKDTVAEGACAKLERVTDCGESAAQRWVFSAVEVRPTVAVIDGSVGDAPDIQSFFGGPADDTRRKKKTRTAKSIVRITVPITGYARRASDLEHAKRCKWHPDSAWCNIATLDVTLVLRRGEKRMEVAVRGSIGMPLSQPFNRFFVPGRFPYCFEGPRVPRWDPRMRFSIVELPAVCDLLDSDEAVRRFVGRALLNAALLMYADTSAETRVLLIPSDVCALVPSVRPAVLGAAEAFGIMKLVMTMPLAFLIDPGGRLQRTRPTEAMVRFDDAGGHSLHTLELLRRIYGASVPRLALKPAETTPSRVLREWRDWWCSASFARAIYDTYSTFHRIASYE